MFGAYIVQSYDYGYDHYNDNSNYNNYDYDKTTTTTTTTPSTTTTNPSTTTTNPSSTTGVNYPMKTTQTDSRYTSTPLNAETNAGSYSTQMPLNAETNAVTNAGSYSTQMPLNAETNAVTNSMQTPLSATQRHATYKFHSTAPTHAPTKKLEASGQSDASKGNSFPHIISQWVHQLNWLNV